MLKSGGELANSRFRSTLLVAVSRADDDEETVEPLRLREACWLSLKAVTSNVVVLANESQSSRTTAISPSELLIDSVCTLKDHTQQVNRNTSSSGKVLRLYKVAAHSHHSHPRGWSCAQE